MSILTPAIVGAIILWSLPATAPRLPHGECGVSDQRTELILVSTLPPEAQYELRTKKQIPGGMDSTGDHSCAGYPVISPGPRQRPPP